MSGQYLARITGRDPKYQFQRAFVGRKIGKRNDCTQATIDDPGLYEICDATKKGKTHRFRVILAAGEGLDLRKITEAEALGIAKALGLGRTIDQIVRFLPDEGSDTGRYEILSAADAAKAQAAANKGDAEAQCWAILEALPALQAKKVLTALRLRLSPPRPKATEAEPQVDGERITADQGEEPQVEEVRP
jgi:hypothetical protein